MRWEKNENFYLSNIVHAALLQPFSVKGNFLDILQGFKGIYFQYKKHHTQEFLKVKCWVNKGISCQIYYPLPVFYLFSVMHYFVIIVSFD